MLQSAKTYFLIFKLALSNEIIHRMHFLLGVFRNIVFFSTLIFVFQQTTLGIGGYSSDALIKYSILGYFVSSLIFTWYMGSIAEDISEGNLSLYLVRPMNYVLYCCARIFATRVLLLGASFIGAAIIFWITKINLNIFTAISMQQIIAAIGLMFGSLLLVQIIDIIGGVFSFWVIDTGLQWLVIMLVTFLSGAYIPIDALPTSVSTALSFTPFPSLVFVPVSILMSSDINSQLPKLFAVQWFWIAVLFIAVVYLWRRGLVMYEANGR